MTAYPRSVIITIAHSLYILWATEIFFLMMLLSIYIITNIVNTSIVCLYFIKDKKYSDYELNYYETGYRTPVSYVMFFLIIGSIFFQKRYL